MGRSSKPRKAYRPQARPAGPLRTQPWLLDQLLEPVEELLRYVARHGELEVTTKEALVFRSATAGRAYDAVALLLTQADIFGVLRQRDPACPEAGPLRGAAAMLNAGQLTQAQIDAALDCSAAMRAYLATQPVAEIADAAQSVALRHQMDAAENTTARDKSPDE